MSNDLDIFWSASSADEADAGIYNGRTSGDFNIINHKTMLSTRKICRRLFLLLTVSPLHNWVPTGTRELIAMAAGTLVKRYRSWPN